MSSIKKNTISGEVLKNTVMNLTLYKGIFRDLIRWFGKVNIFKERIIIS